VNKQEKKKKKKKKKKLAELKVKCIVVMM